MILDDPAFNEIIDAVKSVGFPVVIALLILTVVVAPLILVIRTLITTVGNKSDEISSQITQAITLFAGTLSMMSNRQEESADRLNTAILGLRDAMNRQNELLIGIQKSQDITVRFIAENMASLASHRERVEHTEASPPTTGVLQPVEIVQPKETPDEPGS